MVRIMKNIFTYVIIINSFLSRNASFYFTLDIVVKLIVSGSYLTRYAFITHNGRIL